MLQLTQEDAEELLDLNAGSVADARESLADLRRINRILGGTKVLLDALGPRLIRLAETVTDRPITVVDIGPGSADIPLAIVRFARRRGIHVRIVGVDLNRRHLRIAQNETITFTPEIALVCADGFQLPLADGGADFVISSLFLHHFRPPEIARLLREARRVARHGWIMNDLWRHRLPLVFIQATAPIFARSYITKFDSVASLRRAYTPSEMRAIAIAAHVGPFKLTTPFPFRLCLESV